MSPATKARFEKWARFGELHGAGGALMSRPTAYPSWDNTDYVGQRRDARIRKLLRLAQGCQSRSMSDGMEED